jgi:dimethylhistidine N-methyltransferase
MHKKKNQLLSDFAEAVMDGLSDYPKHLPSRYIYDQQGDKLFQQIMQLPEYYLTRCEMEILAEYKTALAKMFSPDGKPFNLIELGAGDGTKTRLLLQSLKTLGASFTFMPIDISENALEELENRLKSEFPGLAIDPWKGTYFQMLEQINNLNEDRKVILFLGSNIGNMLHPEAVRFLRGLQQAMRQGDFLLVGFDQKKDPQKILDAYNDATGVTAAFNKNILRRINREFGANFDLDKFKHWEVYDPQSGSAKSYLLAKETLEVRIEALDLNISFHPWESIHVELSQKYDNTTVEWLAREAGLEVLEEFSDCRGYYKNYLFNKRKV